MSIELSYKDLKKELLSAQGLELLSEFALIWRTKTGEVIDLESADQLLSYISEGRTCRYVSGEAENRQRMAA